MWETFYQQLERKKEPSYRVKLLEETLAMNHVFQKEVLIHFEELMERIPRIQYPNLFVVLSKISNIEFEIENYFFLHFPFGELKFTYSLIKTLKKLFPNYPFLKLERGFEMDLSNCCQFGKILSIDLLMQVYDKELSEENTIALLKSKVEVCGRGEREFIYQGMIDALIDDMKRCAKELNQDDTLHYLQHGYYSYAARVGDLVLKVGNARNTNDDFQISQKAFTYAKFNYEEDDICIQLMDYVENKDITQEDVYMVYKKLRDEHIIWTDTRESNIGRQVENRKRRFPLPNEKAKEMLQISSEIDVSDSIVLLDIDYLYDQKDENIKAIMYPILAGDFKISHTYDYEIRYQLEKSGISFEHFDEYTDYYQSLSREKVLTLHKKSLTSIK